MIKVTKKYHPIRFATYDIETLGLVPINFMYGVVYYGDSYEVFLDRNEMLEEIYDRKNRGMVFFGHNCEFDLIGLTNDNIFKALDNVLYRGSHFISAQKIIYTGDRKKEYVRFWDSMRILMSSLGKIGEVLGYPKQKIPELLLNKKGLEYSEGLKIFHGQWENRELREKYLEYCLTDTVLLYKALDQFQNFIWNKYHCGLKSTISSIAFSIWKRNFLKEMWHDCNTGPNMAFKNAYYGGRVDVFRWGKTDNINIYDINSLYPYEGLKEYPHPYKLYYTTDRSIYRKYEGCGLFDIKAPDLHIPILPYRKKGKLLFPVGDFRGWYNFNEIRYAEENGYEVKFNKGYFAYDTVSPLKEYYQGLYSERKKYPKSNYNNVILKYLMNSLYGRFGLKIENKEYMYEIIYYNSMVCDYCGTDFLLYENKSCPYCNSDKYSAKFDGKHFNFTQLTTDGYGIASNVTEPYSLSETTYYAIPSYLTSYARIDLHKALSQYTDAVIYCDTDSMVLEGRELSPTLISKDLGDWKNEGRFDSGWFYGCKFYSLLENRALWYKWNAIDVKIKGLKMYEKLERIGDLPKSKEVISYFKSKESLRRDKIAGSKKITEKRINPYVFDKRIYDNEIDFTVESVNTYPITINSDNETLIY